MNRSFSLFVFFLLMTSSLSFSQTVYTFVAGTDVPTALSGDALHQYEYRITADPLAHPASLVIYDAGLGSKADVIASGGTTKTTFQLFPASGAKASQAMQTLTAGNEQKFRGRWFPFASLDPASSPNGWILRVTASDGNDINAFQVDVVDGNDSSLTGTSWSITSFHLPVLITGLNDNEEIQIPLLTAQKQALNFSVSGKSSLRTALRNSFGQSSGLSTSSEFLSSAYSSIANTCGLIVSGSTKRTASFVLINKNDSSVVWKWLPITTVKQRPPAINTAAQPGSAVNSVQLLLADATKRELTGASPLWVFGKTVIPGSPAVMQFSKPGSYTVKVFVPTHGMYYPQYYIGECKVHINAPPVAVISAVDHAVTPGTVVTLSAKESYDPDKQPLHYQWFVNNEFRSSQPSFRFSSSLPGTYEVRLVVDDGSTHAGSSSSSSAVLLHVNAAPYAEINAPRIIARNAQVKFFVKNDFDSDGDELKFTWSGQGIFGDVHGRSVAVKQDKAGSFPITLTVDDQSGTENAVYTTAVTYQVNADPVPMFKLPERAAVGQEVLLSPIKPSGGDTKNLTYHWKISDGNELKSEEAALSFDTPGDYEVSLIVDDGEGLENSVQTFTRTIHINAPPVIVWNVPANIALGDSLKLDASQSHDPDGSIIEYEWKVDNKIAGNTAVVSIPVTSAGAHTVALRITDNSGTSSRSITQTAGVRVNSKPSPQFTLPASVYEGESVSLLPDKTTDQDGDTLSFLWEVDGIRTGNKTAVLAAGKHVITLIADDHRGLKNSIDSLPQNLYVAPKPNLKSLDVPKDWLLGSDIAIASITNVSHVGFVANNRFAATVHVDTAGQQYITLGWAPHNDILAQERFAIQVWQPLEFTSHVEPQMLPWHPANPSTVLTAPNVNRPETRKVKFEWRSGTTLIGSGKVVEVPLKAGKNIFTVQAIDLDMLGARSVTTDIIVTCE